jgi:hypothetical protein
VISRADGQPTKGDVDQWIDDLTKHVDYHTIQEGEDLSQLTRSGVGVHYAGRNRLPQILKGGLGERPDIYDHEWPSWAASRLGYDDAFEVGMAVLTRRGDPWEITNKALRRDKNLRVLWFGDEDYEGETATGSVRIELDMHGIGEWVASKGHAVVFSDGAGGWALSWNGPARIPARYFSVQK